MRFPQTNSLDVAAHVGLELKMRIVQMWGKRFCFQDQQFYQSRPSTWWFLLDQHNLPLSCFLLIRLTIRTLGNIFLVSPLLCTALPSALKHPQMSFQYAYENCSCWDPLWDRFKRSPFALRVSELFVLLSSPRVLWLLRSTAHFSEAFFPFTPFPRRWQKFFFAFVLQHNPRRDLEYRTGPSHCSAKWEQDCSVSLSQGLWGNHIIPPIPTLSLLFFPHLTMHHHVFS